MLQRLSQASALLQFCQDDGRFHFTLRGDRQDMVRPSTMDALTKAGFLRRESTAQPSYVINEKGLAELNRRWMPVEDAPVIPKITLSAKSIGK
jgi:hypothetical protein